MPGPVICNQVDPCLTELLASHPSNPKVIERLDRLTPWDIPPETEILVTRLYDSWSGAPQSGRDLPGLRWIQTYSAGVEGYPRWLTQDRLVSCGRGLASVQISEYVMAAIMRVEKDFEGVRVRAASDWINRPMGRLAGRSLGLLGYGSIGRAIARRALAFDMNVQAYRRGPWREADADIKHCQSPEALIAGCDHLVLALPLTDETRGLVGDTLLSRAKIGLHLINISRGAVLDQQALIKALDARFLSCATLDVTVPEPLPENSPLLSRQDIFITPHISYAGGRGEMEMFGARLFNNLGAYLDGRHLEEQVDMSRGY
ncbi:NAD(P)-dependent oxidoreductase [Rhizobium rhizogenes]|uniref:NAD(P)-dependent oxidoreductase n=1 Tax=Rhizobium rhizogenes TaxID=359 RepID=UPI00064658B5|nr:NAD(P)-dependent oxidoreductase [Rhizobium rhizogenes]